MSARHTLTLDAALIAQILRRLAPAVRAEIVRVQAEVFHSFPVIEFWQMWLGNSWGAFATGAEREAFDAAIAAWEALAHQAQADALDAEVDAIDAIEAPVMPTPPHSAKADDTALLDEAEVMMDAEGIAAWNAAGRLAPRAKGEGNLNSRQRRLWRQLLQRRRNGAV